MALESRAASSLREALALTPNQVVLVTRAIARLREGLQPQQRRGTPDDFKAMILAMAAG